jgi:hypothetical protein
MPQVDINLPPITQPSARRVDFKKSHFDDNVWNKGYNVIIERAIRCPCKTKGGDHLLSCMNCGGLGFVFYNPVKTRVLSTGTTARRDERDWGEEETGSKQVTAMSTQQIGYMDKITYLDSKAYYSEVLFVNSTKQARSVYYINQVEDAFLFVNESTKLLPLTTTEYTTDGNVITFTGSNVQPNSLVSIRYEHFDVFHIVEMIREVMVTNIKKTSTDDVTHMPAHAVAKKAHYVFTKLSTTPNAVVGQLFDNTFSHPVDQYKIE